MSFLSDLAEMAPEQREQLIANLVIEREREIDRAIRHLERRLRLRRIASLLPATEPSPLEGGVSPGAVVAGASHMEQNA